jgi:hypothetical protein
MAVDLRSVTVDLFEPRLNEAFALVLQGRELPLTLVDVRRLGQARRAGGAFSLIFAAPPGSSVLPQAIYSLGHPELGTLELFLVPINPTEYQAVFA